MRRDKGKTNMRGRGGQGRSRSRWECNIDWLVDRELLVAFPVVLCSQFGLWVFSFFLFFEKGTSFALSQSIIRHNKWPIYMLKLNLMNLLSFRKVIYNPGKRRKP